MTNGENVQEVRKRGVFDRYGRLLQMYIRETVKSAT